MRSYQGVHAAYQNASGGWSTLIDINSNKFFTPASNNKLLTTAAFFTKLGTAPLAFDHPVDSLVPSRIARSTAVSLSSSRCPSALTTPPPRVARAVTRAEHPHLRPSAEAHC